MNYKGNCFAIMPFDDGFTPVFEDAFKPACRDYKHRCWRVDEVRRPGSITADVIAGIIDADFLIADLTGANANVFYELGVAHALEKKVILVSQDVANTPFDLRAYRTIKYQPTALDRLREHLAEFISETLAMEWVPGNPVQEVVDARRRIAREPRRGGQYRPRDNDVAMALGERLAEAQLDRMSSKIQSALDWIADPENGEDKATCTVIGSDNIYVQFAMEKDLQIMTGETVSNDFLKGRERLDPDALTRLGELGWEPPGPGMVNHHRSWFVHGGGDSRVIALEAIRALTEVYRVPPGADLKIKLLS